MKIDTRARAVIDILKRAGYEAYIVGGSVRDYLLGLDSHDIDITTCAHPDEIKQVFADFRTIDTGIRHGTVTILYEDLPIEVTTFRADGEYLDHRRPKQVSFVRNLKEDLMRRDFTINAMAYDEDLIDIFGGRDDLENKLIRAVGDPDMRFREDALRILRALRFASQLGFKIERRTALAMRKNRELLRDISAERVQKELNQILLGKNVKNVLQRYYDIIAVCIPEILRMVGFDQHNKYHVYDVYKHSIVALAKSKCDLIVRLTLLFHDIGKPEVFSLDENGCGHFYRHATESVKITRTIFNRLKYDNDTKNQVLRLIEYHDAVLSEDDKSIKRWLNRLGEDLFKKLIEVQKGDNFGQNPALRDRQNRLENICKRIDEIVAEKECFSLRQLAIDGYDMIALGYSGAEIKTALNFALESVINNKVTNDKDAIIEYLKAKLKIKK